MSEQQSEAVARRFYEILNSGELGLYSELLSRDFIDRNPVPGQAPGPAGVQQALAGFRRAFPDLRFDIEEMLTCGDRVIVRLAGRGTHKGEFMGVLPTGRQVKFMAMDIHRVAGNRIVESWHIEDLLTVMVQLGALKVPAVVA